MKQMLLQKWGKELGVLGRVYLSPEGINAQMTVPLGNVERLRKSVRFQPVVLFISVPGSHLWPLKVVTYVQISSLNVFKKARLYEGDEVNMEDSANRPFESLHIRIRSLVRCALRSFECNAIPNEILILSFLIDTWIRHSSSDSYSRSWMVFLYPN